MKVDASERDLVRELRPPRLSARRMEWASVREGLIIIHWNSASLQYLEMDAETVEVERHHHERMQGQRGGTHSTCCTPAGAAYVREGTAADGARRGSPITRRSPG